MAYLEIIVVVAISAFGAEGLLQSGDYRLFPVVTGGRGSFRTDVGICQGNFVSGLLDVLAATLNHGTNS